MIIMVILTKNLNLIAYYDNSYPIYIMIVLKKNLWLIIDFIIRNIVHHKDLITPKVYNYEMPLRVTVSNISI